MAEKRWRDAVTGEYVTPDYAADHPDTTVGETVSEQQPPEPPADEPE